MYSPVNWTSKIQVFDYFPPQPWDGCGFAVGILVGIVLGAILGAIMVGKHHRH